MALVKLCGLSMRGVPVVASGRFSPWPLLRAGCREPTETSLAYQALDLVFEVNTLLGIVAVVLMEMAVFGLVSPVGIFGVHVFLGFKEKGCHGG